MKKKKASYPTPLKRGVHACGVSAATFRRLVGFAHHFDDTVVLDTSVAALAYKAIVVGAVRRVGEVGIPKLVFSADIVNLVDKMAPAVIDGEFIVGITVVLNEVGDVENVVVSIVVGGDGVGELECGGDDTDGVDNGVSAVEGVAMEADVHLGEREPYAVGGGELDVGGVPTVGGVGDGSGVDIIRRSVVAGGIGLFLELPEGGASGV